MNILHEKLINAFIDKAQIYIDAELIAKKLKEAYPNQNLVHKKTIARFLDGTTQNPRDGLLGFLAAYVLSMSEEEVDLADKNGTLNEIYETFVQTVGYITPKDLKPENNEKQLSKTIQVLILVIIILCGIVVSFLLRANPTETTILSITKPPMQSIPGGTFLLGDTFDQAENTFDNEKPVVSIYIEPFEISEKEITFGQFDDYCNEQALSLKSDLWGRKSQPVIMVSWYDAISYCNWLSKLSGFDSVYSIEKDKDGFQKVNADLSKNGYRLPTEAEFEYAASLDFRSKKKFLFGNNKNIANIEDGLNFNCTLSQNERFTVTCANSELKTVEVEKSSTNSTGLFGMSGNVAEWCHDRYIKNRYSNILDTINPVCNEIDIPYAAVRGGSFKSDYKCIRTTFRCGKALGACEEDLGFRVVRRTK